MKKLSFSLLCIALTGCTVGPDYVKPPVVMSTVYKEATPGSENKDWKLAEPKDDCSRDNWWEVFDDAQLNFLVEELNKANQSIKNAEANYRQALAIVEQARADYYPTLGFIGSGTRQKRTQAGGSSSAALFATTVPNSTATGGTFAGTFGGVSPLVSTLTSLSLNAAWEPDIWGLVRRNVEANVAAAQASAALLASTQLSLQASLAQYYFELRALDTDQRLLDDTVKSYQESLRFTKNQYASGVLAQSDILQAQSLLETAQAAAINNKILRAQYEHAIAVLIGVPPAALTMTFDPLGTTKPPVIPVEVPSALLERRPDVAQAERLMAQANAQVGVAIAAYYPNITLSAANGLTGISQVLKLFTKPAESWSLGGQLTETLFDGGLRNATLQAARAVYDANVANYRQIVLTAMQNVEDSLISLRMLDEQSAILNQAAQDAREALTIILNQYKAGTVDYNNVLTAQINTYNAEKNAADLYGMRMTSAVGLIKALGGGWNANDLNEVADNAYRKHYPKTSDPY